MENLKEKIKDPEVKIEMAIDRSELFIKKYGKQLLIGIAAIFVLVGCYFAYKYGVVEPKKDKASAMMFVAQQLFATDQYEYALAGDGNNKGFLEVIKSFGGTPQGNLARHYAGLSYMKLGHYEDALKYLKEYRATEGVPGQMINATNYGLMGDCYIQLKDMKNGAEYYAKAVAASDNALTTPMYLKKQGMVLEQLGDNASALKLYNRIKYEYSQSMEARDIDKSIGALEQK